VYHPECPDTVLKKHYKSPFPALNVHWRDEALATDTVYSDVPAVDSGVTIAPLFVGLTSTVCDKKWSESGYGGFRYVLYALIDGHSQHGAMLQAGKNS
jgi:hypothetical protein